MSVGADTLKGIGIDKTIPVKTRVEKLNAWVNGISDDELTQLVFGEVRLGSAAIAVVLPGSTALGRYPIDVNAAVTRAIEIFKEGRVSQIAFCGRERIGKCKGSRGQTIACYMRDTAMREGIPKKRMLTVRDAYYVSDALGDLEGILQRRDEFNCVRSMMFIGAPYVMRQACIFANKYFPHVANRLLCPYESAFNRDSWRSNPAFRKLVQWEAIHFLHMASWGNLPSNWRDVFLKTSRNGS